MVVFVNKPNRFCIFGGTKPKVKNQFRRPLVKMVCVCATGIAVAVTSCRYWAFQRPSLSWDCFHWSSTAKDFISGWVLIDLYHSCRSCWLHCTVLSVSATSGWKPTTYCGRRDNLFIMIVYFCHIFKEKCHHHVRFNGRFSGAPGLVFFFQKTTIDIFFTGKMPFLSPNLICRLFSNDGRQHLHRESF